MKKFLFLTLISAVITTTIHAQGNNQGAAQVKDEVKPQATAVDDATMLKMAKEKQKPLMIEKTGLSDAQVDRIIEINFEIRQAARGLKDLNEADRSTKLAELKALKEKKYSEILTAEQIKTVYAYYEEMGKNKPPKPAN